MVHACNWSTWEVEAGESGVQDHLSLYSKLEASLDYIVSKKKLCEHVNHEQKPNHCSKKSKA